ncbi:hypothetical protein JCM8097_006791 [Rhodosporidiobolus ruineniae]
MYFCSQEHQNLVWTWHKEVCGGKGNPFTFPNLSKHEVEFALQNIETPASALYMAPLTLRSLVTQTCGGPVPDAVIKGLGKNAKPIYPTSKHQALLSTVRKISSKPSPTPFAGSMEQFYLSKTVWQWTTCQSERVTQAVSLSATGRPWLSGLQHRILLFSLLEHLRCAVNCRGKRQYEPDLTSSYTQQSFMSLARFVQTDINPKYPKDAAVVAHEMQVWYIPVDRSLLPPGMPSPEDDPAYYGFAQLRGLRTRRKSGSPRRGPPDLLSLVLLSSTMELPLPNELLTLVFAYLDVRTLRAVCLSTRGLAHVARPFLYSLLPLPFIHLRNHGFVLDPGAYARFKAVTDDDGTSGAGNVSLRRAVKTVKITADGERTARRQYPERLEWTPKNVLSALVKTLDTVAFRVFPSLPLLATLVQPISTNLRVLEAPLVGKNSTVPFSLFPKLRCLYLNVYHATMGGSDTDGSIALQSLSSSLRIAKQVHSPHLKLVDIAFRCSHRWCFSCRAPTEFYGRLLYGPCEGVVEACEAEGMELYFEDKLFVRTT